MSGVPQLPNLGPLLFILYINGVANIIDTKKLLFADGLKIFIKMILSIVSNCNLILRVYLFLILK